MFLQYLCTSESTWEIAGRSVTTATVCGYSPYREVQCDIKAYNAGGDSETASSSSVTTDCAGKQ